MTGSIFGVGTIVALIVLAGLIIIYYYYRTGAARGVTALMLALFHLVGGVCFYLGYEKWGLDGGVICSLAGPYILFVALTYQESEQESSSGLDWFSIFLIVWLLSDHHHD